MLLKYVTQTSDVVTTRMSTRPQYRLGSGSAEMWHQVGMVVFCWILVIRAGTIPNDMLLAFICRKPVELLIRFCESC
jgi:hypothetical protein